jgi:outer membrane protein assembly factor BamB
MLVGRNLRLRRTACFLSCMALGIVIAPSVLASTESPGPAGTPDWTVYHDDPAGSGVAVGVGSVDTAARAWTSPTLDGQLYGEPLVLGDLAYVATENDMVYALSTATGAIAWSARLGAPVPAEDLPCSNIGPNLGITGTPVIDPARQEIYVVADVLVNGKPHHMLTGLNTATGSVELSQDVDPPGQEPAALLQRTGLTLDDGSVYFGFGGNAEDCGPYKGRVVGVPEAGGTPRFFSTAPVPDGRMGGVWMGGGAPAIGPNGDIWVSTGNGSQISAKSAYDDSDGLLELSPSLHLLQYFAPANWWTNNSDDLDMTTAPVLFPDGQVLLAGKSQTIYLLNGKHLGGIGTQQAELNLVCSTNIDGGSAHVGMIVYLPCLTGIIAIKAAGSPPSLHMLWSSGIGGGPPIVAGGLVWTISQSGKLYGIDPATGKVRQQANIGTIINHFPTPGIGAGLMLAPTGHNVVAFRTTAGVGQGAATTSSVTSPGPATSGHTIVEVVLGCVVAVVALSSLVWLVRRQRRA